MGGKAEKSPERGQPGVLGKARRRELFVLGSSSGVRSFDEAKAQYSYPAPENKQVQGSPASA